MHIRFIIGLLKKEYEKAKEQFEYYEEERRLVEIYFRHYQRQFRYYGTSFWKQYKFLKQRWEELKPFSVWSYHHSRMLALKELIFRYEALLSGRSGRIPNLSVQHKDYHLKEFEELEEKLTH